MLSGGLVVSLKSSTPTAVTAVLSVDKALAKKLGLKPGADGRALAGRGRGVASPQAGKVTVRLLGKAKAKVKRLKRVTMRLELTLASAAGTTTVVRRAVVLK